MLELINLMVAGITFSFSILCLIVRLSIQFGRFVRRFEEVVNRVEMHDKLLGLPEGAVFKPRPFGNKE